MNRDELAARLLETFIAELDDHVEALNRHLLALEANPDAIEDRRAAFRVVHTLKGAARAAGVGAVEATCHRLESLLAQVRDETRMLDADAMAVLFKGVGEFADIAVQLRAGRKTEELARSDSGASTSVQVTANQYGPKSQNQRTTERQQPTEESKKSTVKDVLPESTAEQIDSTPLTADVRVRAEQLYTLLGASSRLLMTSGQVMTLHRELDQLRSVLSNTLVRQSDKFSRDHLHEVQEVLRGAVRDLSRLVTDSAETTRQLAVVTSDIGLGVRSLRLRPFADAVALLPGLVRDAAAETGKQIQLEIIGSDIEADRTVLDEMREAILHLVRNAIAHGIESSSQRTSAGKPPAGTVRVTAKVVVDHIVVTVEDDGAGIDVPKIRAVLDRQGETLPPDDTALIRRLFEGGVSTKETADSIAGRGVGLDAVSAAMSRIRGSVDVTWRAGQGTVFTLEAPVALATIRAVLVNIGAHVIAIPDAYIHRLVRIKSDEVKIADGRTVIPFGDVPVPFVSLARLLGPPMTDRATGDTFEVVIVASGSRRLALAVDHLLGEEEVVVRPILNKGKRELPHVSGAVLLRSGKVALVANVGALLATGLGDAASAASPVTQVMMAPTRSRILVADDSITTRTLEQSVLEMAGYEVMTAVDGADAWRLLQERGADVVVSDVEMPRMDGFTLCQQIRSSSRFRELPVILVTALETTEDRERGIEAGADAYLTKSSFDQETLLDTIRQLIS